MALQDTLKKMKSDLEELSKEIRRKSEEGLKVALKEFFAECPEIEKLSWAQYVPSFNDGDPCEFTVTGISGIIKPEYYAALDIEAPQYEDEDEEAELLEEALNDEGLYPLAWDDKNPHERLKELNKAIDALERIIRSSEMESVLENTFGYGVRVIATAEKVTTEDYDCGY